MEVKDKTLNCSAEFKLKTVEFSPKQYAKLKQTLKTMEYDERKAPVLAVKENAAINAVAKQENARSDRGIECANS